MSDLISILIVDDNIELGDTLEEYLSQCEDITVKGVARDGIEALKILKDIDVDIVLLDLIMPNLDGIGVLERIPSLRLKHKPIFVALSAIAKDIFIRKAIELGVEYYILKPFDLNMLLSRIRQIASDHRDRRNHVISTPEECLEVDHKAEKTTFEQIVTSLIREMGITPNITGYHYLRDAVIHTAKNHFALHSMTRYIYPDIAKKYNTTARNVDRAIRCAVENAYNKSQSSGSDFYNLLSDSAFKTKPTNVKIIGFLADKAKSEMGDPKRNSE